MNQSLAIILIAAGNSSRLGHPKQLINFAGKTLLERSCQLALSCSARVFVILGYEANKMQPLISQENIMPVFNTHWQQGMGTSIACGIEQVVALTQLAQSSQKSLLKEQQTVNTGSIKGAMILLCDQWRLTQSDLQHLITTWQNNPHKIIASEYYEHKSSELIQGAPVIFPVQYFSQLAALTQTGARFLLKKNPQDVIAVPIENAAFDIDLAEDFKQLKIYEQQHYPAIT
ncbi:nucleotidyltransferase family protein [Aliikangiella maris]|uniref:Nucleotidyltransferase family protein n=2 Tax=Aliikangiella maris TaxID=3162458 RepID=A0ABV3MPG3_9GAMM